MTFNRDFSLNGVAYKKGDGIEKLTQAQIKALQERGVIAKKATSKTNTKDKR